MKKMLFIFPNYYGFDEVIYQGMIQFANCDINRIDPEEDFIYENTYQKTLNFFSKFFFKKNLKQYYFKQQKIRREINENKYYDYIFINRPDLLSLKNLALLEKKSEIRIVLYWDSFSKIPQTLTTIKFFNKLYSFDKDDCNKYNLNFITNFYFDIKNDSKIEYDFYYLATYDKRYKFLLRIIEYLENENFKIGRAHV